MFDFYFKSILKIYFSRHAVSTQGENPASPAYLGVRRLAAAFEMFTPPQINPAPEALISRAPNHPALPQQ
ncbi:MAG TPA: hypothetical protein VGD60_06005, partial [Candidatus Acidoferrales bacterium]